jgi:sodium-dependent dicarboxylate transporter 2/3/5
MKSIRRYLDKFMRWLWERNGRTKTYLRLNAAKMVEDLDVGTEEERRVARRAFADGGQEEKGEEKDAKGDEGEDGDDDSPFDVGDDYGRRQRVGFVLGPVLFALIFFAPTPEGLAPEGQAVTASTAWAAVWWISEAIPIPATSLLPVVLFPLTGALPVAETTPSYAHPLVFLFMGGFFLAMAMQRWNLHRRIALRTIKYVGTEPSRLILGFMVATAFLSMWVSNTATVMMMVPIALAVVYQTADLLEDADTDIETEEGEFRFGVALMLCIAYGASVGGVATLIGTPPNILFAGQAAELFGDRITFFEWMLYGVPVAAVGIAAVYVYVTRLAVAPRFEAVPAGDRVINEELESLGSMSRQERLVLVVFAGMATAWIGSSLVRQANFIPVPEDIDTVVAILGALVLFTVPTRTEDGEHTFLLDWTSGVKIPWGVILLFGGGLR